MGFNVGDIIVRKYDNNEIGYRKVMSIGCQDYNLSERVPTAAAARRATKSSWSLTIGYVNSNYTLAMDPIDILIETVDGNSDDGRP